MQGGTWISELTHILYGDDTPLHPAAAGLRYGAAGTPPGS